MARRAGQALTLPRRHPGAREATPCANNGDRELRRREAAPRQRGHKSEDKTQAAGPRGPAAEVPTRREPKAQNRIFSPEFHLPVR